MSYSTLRQDLDEHGVLTLTLDRAERLNAFNHAMQEELIDAFGGAEGDDRVRAVVITGAGRGFCAGADLSARGGSFRNDGETGGGGERPGFRDGGGLVALQIYRSTKPMIAAINGPAVGIGITMTLPMDIRIASSAARMGFVFTRRGMVPEACSSFFLPRIVGVSQAAEWMLTGRVFDAEEALRGGLVSRVTAPDALLPTAHSIAREITDHTAPVSVALTRQMLWRQLSGSSPMGAHRIESLGISTRGRSRDVIEGVESFLDKRSPSFPETVSSDLPDYYPWWTEEGFDPEVG